MGKVINFFLVFFLFISFSYAQEVTKKSPLKAKITFIAGIVEVQKKGEISWRKAKIGTILSKYDKIRTFEDSLAEISISDSSCIRLSELTTIEVSKIKKDKKGESNSFFLWMGNIWIKTIKIIDREASIEVKTPIAVAGIRGTTFSAKVAKDTSTQVHVFEGEVKVANLPSKKNISKAEEKKKAPQEIAKPYKEVKKPYHEVSCEEWCEIVKAMEQITIFPDGSYKKSKLEEEELDLDPWIKWNKNRDELLKNINNLGSKPSSE